MFYLSLILALLIGVSLGLLGSGGSIVTLPVLVYVAGVSAESAVPMSLAVVGSAALVGAVLKARQGQVHRRAVLLFATTGAIGAWFGARLTPLVLQQVLMLIFSGLMLAAAGAMIRKPAKRAAGDRCFIPRCLLIGTCVGVLTGFIGVGGGFLIVPALVLFASIETTKAVGSSLAIVAVNSASGLISHLQHQSIDVRLTLTFVTLALAGMWMGTLLAERLTETSLRRTFAGFVIAVGVAVGAINIHAVL